MEMTALQIASEYRTGKDKTKTIKVLAELNAVTQRRIAEILQEQGEELPGHWKAKLEQPLQRKPREPVTQRELGEAIAQAVTPKDAEEKERIATPACTPVRNDSAALSLDGIRQAARPAISWAQYSRLMRIIGRMEGYGMAQDDENAPYIVGVAEKLFALAEEIKPETAEETD